VKPTAAFRLPPLALGAALALAAAPAAAATAPQQQHQPPAPQPRAAAPQQQRPQQPGLDKLITGIGPLCLKAPAAQCVDQGFAYADRDRDGRLSLPEAKSVEAEVSAWTKANAGRLPPEERQRLVTGLVVFQTVGTDNLFASYDSNGDGALTKDEVLADVKLDKRPLPQVLSDPASVNWDRLAARAGSAAPLLKRLFPM
jgi:hypothetical protein